MYEGNLLYININVVVFSSLFRLANDGEAFAKFGLFSARLNALIDSSSSIFLDNNLQKTNDVMNEHPSWMPIHIASFLGLYEFFNQANIKKYDITVKT